MDICKFDVLHTIFTFFFINVVSSYKRIEILDRKS